MRLGPALALSLLICVACSSDGTGGSDAARYLGSFTWTDPDPTFGGLSALELSDDGLSAVVLSDRSRVMTARLQRDGDGRITGAELANMRRLRGSTGKFLTHEVADSEGLAVAPDGSIYISFEGVHRVVRYDRLDGPAHGISDPDVFRGMKQNKSLEALAIDPQGRLVTMPEGYRDGDGNIPVYRREKGGWRVVFALPARGSFLPVGADFGPDGRLYLLERALGLVGFRSRLRRWTVTETGPGEEQTLLTTATGTHDNLEGLSIWRDGTGRLRATMVADDNFLRFQRTELVDYILPD